ncbi:molybdenum cofactor cytidylyltransferase [Saonia flava]|uniref:Molybdenum cofactor cytidylyltransferase n=1 Tax=Saonia flava TaxID=523696 RepID=A0A846QSC4_9FLAO|nr:nucleotidyltransferase family protein [Saonia flava]NJB69870.1 molybdenum cofactor cytidylyltransferase [Saonia flava]
MHSTNKNIAILILAAGSASRMGKLKQLLPWKDTTLLGHTIETACSCSQDVYVVVGAQSNLIKQKIKSTVTYIDNTNWEMGLGNSIACGIQYLLDGTKKYGTCLIMLADQPFIDVDYLNELIRKHNEFNVEITATKYKNRAGVPAIFNASYFEELSSIKGDIGAKNILKKYENSILCIDSNGKTQDIDTKEVYQKILK